MDTVAVDDGGQVSGGGGGGGVMAVDIEDDSWEAEDEVPVDALQQSPEVCRPSLLFFGV